MYVLFSLSATPLASRKRKYVREHEIEITVVTRVNET